jgi:alkylation response protein AidB-like acyl-CoA dehydrogenase
MSTITQTYEEALQRICRENIAPNAFAVDHEGAFPDQAIESLKTGRFLGAMSSPEVDGLGFGLPGTAMIVRRVAEECGSTAMVLCMHYCGAAVLEAHAPSDVRRAAAAGSHLSTLAFSEAGSRSHFWAPLNTATDQDGDVILNDRKSWVTSASHATAYVWSSRPLAAAGMSTVWLVPANASGLTVQGPFEGLGAIFRHIGSDCTNRARPRQFSALGALAPAGGEIGRGGRRRGNVGERGATGSVPWGSRPGATQPIFSVSGFGRVRLSAVIG